MQQESYREEFTLETFKILFDIHLSSNDMHVWLGKESTNSFQPQIFTVFQNTAIRKCNILWEQFYE